MIYSNICGQQSTTSKSEQHKLHYKPVVNSEWSAVSASNVTNIVLLLLQTYLWLKKGSDYDYDKRNISVVMLRTVKLWKWELQLNH
jgi:hypothetical protein